MFIPLSHVSFSHDHMAKRSHYHIMIFSTLEYYSMDASHWGQGGLEINENILSTLQALVESTCHLPADNRLGTFQMYPDHVFDLEPIGTFMQHLKFPQ